MIIYLLYLRSTQAGKPICVGPIEDANQRTNGLFDKIETFLVDDDAHALFREPRDEPSKEPATALRGQPTKVGKGKSLLPVSAVLQEVFSYLHDSMEGRRLLMRELFGIDSNMEGIGYENYAYFIGFRHSTVDGKIVKTFIVMKTPQEKENGFFTYTHILKSGRISDAIGQKIHKITRGVIVNWAVSAFLVGYTQRYHSGSSNLENAVSMEMITLERDAIMGGEAVISALIMSSGAHEQPIVARMALIKVGDFKTFGKKLWDTDVHPTEIEHSDLKKCIEDDFKRLIEKGFPLDEERLVPETIADFVAKSINCIALWELSSDNPDRIEKAVSRGAIEAWGGRNRP